MNEFYEQLVYTRNLFIIMDSLERKRIQYQEQADQFREKNLPASMTIKKSKNSIKTIVVIAITLVLFISITYFAFKILTPIIYTYYVYDIEVPDYPLSNIQMQAALMAVPIGLIVSFVVGGFITFIQRADESSKRKFITKITTENAQNREQRQKIHAEIARIEERMNVIEQERQQHIETRLQLAEKYANNPAAINYFIKLLEEGRVDSKQDAIREYEHDMQWEITHQNEEKMIREQRLFGATNLVLNSANLFTNLKNLSQNKEALNISRQNLANNQQMANDTKRWADAAEQTAKTAQKIYKKL